MERKNQVGAICYIILAFAYALAAGACIMLAYVYLNAHSPSEKREGLKLPAAEVAEAGRGASATAR